MASQQVLYDIEKNYLSNLSSHLGLENSKMININQQLNSNIERNVVVKALITSIITLHHVTRMSI
jgi:hypothetical protein